MVDPPMEFLRVQLSIHQYMEQSVILYAKRRGGQLSKYPARRSPFVSDTCSLTFPVDAAPPESGYYLGHNAVGVDICALYK